MQEDYRGVPAQHSTICVAWSVVHALLGSDSKVIAGQCAHHDKHSASDSVRLARAYWRSASQVKRLSTATPIVSVCRHSSR